MLKALGAVLVTAGVLYSAWSALSGRRLSRPPDNQNSPSLEPRGQGLKFLGLTRNIPAIVLIVVGGILLLYAD
ncbi:hypothetical protein [Phyllobacterium chamaecytisi]|uniref:hypothetical protein n=1 Tax=Phyllobacterium chamaecytisi TaxID=2876082 RepID=UPI001CC9C934|nr:hypothetical protein [Phyllobacterium sp. KW56]MBZ9605261.1 hypothetical protein [Phyllobacterium sp. KW56]